MGHAFGLFLKWVCIPVALVAIVVELMLYYREHDRDDDDE